MNVINQDAAQLEVNPEGVAHLEAAVPEVAQLEEVIQLEVNLEEVAVVREIAQLEVHLGEVAHQETIK